MAIRFGDCVFDKELVRLTRAGKQVHLTPKAFQLLDVLLDHRPRPVATATIEDLGSRNGTLVNGRPAQGATVLNDGDRLQLGPVKLTVRLIDRAQPTQPMPG